MSLEHFKKIWKPPLVLYRPNAIQSPRNYFMDNSGKVYHRRRKNLKPRSNTETVRIQGGDPLLIPPVLPVSRTKIYYQRSISMRGDKVSDTSKS